MTRAFAALGLIVLLAGCGTPAKLKPLEGMSSVPKAAAADKPETAQQLMTPSTQARPDRKADLLTRSVERQSDPFDLPPGPQNGAPARADNAAQPPAGSGNQ